MTPQTEREWTRAIAAVHPDVGGSHERFIAATKARDRWRMRSVATHCACGSRIPQGRTDGCCSPLCARARVTSRTSAPLALKPAPRVRRCESPWCGKVLVETRRRGTRPAKRFCDQRCAARWLQSRKTTAQLRWQGQRAAAMNKLRAKRDTADKFRHVSDLDERVRVAYQAGYQAGYQARVRQGRAA